MALLWVQKLPPTLLHPEHVILKLDFTNARRDKMLEAAKLHTPELFPFVYTSYS